ncbi:T9SS type A sorting domain-containing protein [Wenyingzhuangia sp. 1_MG-2023]|nr:T9SS type A sorting domain-containing protein [Wenyingzhuangia sp. 1_MG-2023]
MKKLVLFCAALLLFIGIGCAQTIKPYLQAAKPNSIYVNWKTDNGNNPEVVYGTESTNLAQKAMGVTEDLEPKDSDYSTPYHYHTVKLEGLSPDTGYYYKASSGETDTSEIHYFKTPPALGDDSGVLRFIALGDHQILNYDGAPYYKYNELVLAAKAKAEVLYGTPLADNFNLIMNDGDQVDLGKLQHYEEIHFQKTSPITPDLPLITAVGNHETYGGSYQNGAMQAYYDHFILDDDWSYGGINSGTERYYAYQMANVLFLVVDSELTNTTQENWLQSVVNYAKTDDKVKWIISIGHRPYEAEQYSNDYSSWFANNALPKLHTTDKYVLHMAGHHHLYARGQFKNHNSYHIISGGTAWPQYWGDSSNEDDREETQGTWSDFAYQFIEINNVTNEMNVKSYTIGSLTTSKDNELLDEFTYKREVETPEKPEITNPIVGTINLPYTLNSSEYQTSTSEVLNSTQFQVASTSDFSIIDIDAFRHVDNYYGPGATTDTTVNIGLGNGILNYTIPEYFLSKGTYYTRVRHRDANLGWSPWSDAISFTVEGSTDGTPLIYLEKSSFETNENIDITFINGKGGSKDWIGVYKEGNEPGTNGSTAYQYVNGSVSGVKTFKLSESGIYYASFFINDGYEEIVKRVTFWVGKIPELTSDKTKYDEGDDVTISFTNHPNNDNDWVGIYKMGSEIGDGNEVKRLNVDTSTQNLTFSGLSNAYYFAVYHVKGSDLTAGEQIAFQVGEQIAELTTSKTTFSEGEPITIAFKDGPGIEKDYIGVIVNDGKPAGTDNLWTYKYFGGLTTGTTTITGKDFSHGGANQLPLEGSYYLAMFTNDSYTQVSNAIPITITKSAAIYMDRKIVNEGENFDINFVNAPGNTKDWIGIYKNGQNPRNVTSQKYQYIDGEANGLRTFELSNGGEYFAGIFENDGYNELGDRVSFVVRGTPILEPTKEVFSEEDDVVVTLTDGGLSDVQDWIGIYANGDEPSSNKLLAKMEVVSDLKTFNFGKFEEGLYYAVYHTESSYNEVGNRTKFQVGNKVVTLSISQSDNFIGEALTFTIADGSGDNEDYLAVFENGNNPATDAFVTYISLKDLVNGDVVINGAEGALGDENVLPKTGGTYFAVVIDQTTGEEISNRVSFIENVKPTATMNVTSVVSGDALVVNYSNGPGNSKDWIGVYAEGQTPGDVNSTTWKYVDGSNLVTGSVTLAGVNSEGDYYLVLLENDGYNEISDRFYFKIEDTLGAKEIKSDDNKIVIYPNPSLGIAYVKAASEIEKVEVYNMNGQLVKTQKQINQTTTTIYLKSMDRGMYVVNVYTEGTVTTLKLLLK